MEAKEREAILVTGDMGFRRRRARDHGGAERAHLWVDRAAEIPSPAAERTRPSRLAQRRKSGGKTTDGLSLPARTNANSIPQGQARAA